MYYYKFQVDCSPTENKALFAGIPFSYGTLGFLTCVDIDIIPYKPYIELTYHNVQTLDEVVNKFTEVTNDPEVDSVEGHMYSLNTGVIMSGKFVDQVPKGAKYNVLTRYVIIIFFGTRHDTYTFKCKFSYINALRFSIQSGLFVHWLHPGYR